MTTKSLLPWDWFNRRNISPKNDENATWEGINTNIERLFNDFIKDFGNMDTLVSKLFRENTNIDLKILPRIDVSETDSEYIIEADLPGVKEEDLDISISKQGLLSLKGKREYSQKENKRNYYKVERSYGSFERVISLPENCNLGQEKATFKNGTLIINIPKKESDDEGIKKIKVNSNPNPINDA